MSESEWASLFAERPAFPKIGMSRCAMHAVAWRYARLVTSAAGTEVWELPRDEGPEIFWDYKPALIIIKDGRIVDRICERGANTEESAGSCDFLDGQFEERFLR